MVKEGKLSEKQLAMVKRWESAHDNAVEGYTFFVEDVVSSPFVLAVRCKEVVVNLFEEFQRECIK
jgi:hypothetical protein